MVLLGRSEMVLLAQDVQDLSVVVSLIIGGFTIFITVWYLMEPGPQFRPLVLAGVDSCATCAVGLVLSVPSYLGLQEAAGGWRDIFPSMMVYVGAGLLLLTVIAGSFMYVLRRKHG